MARNTKITKTVVERLLKAVFGDRFKPVRIEIKGNNATAYGFEVPKDSDTLPLDYSRRINRKH